MKILIATFLCLTGLLFSGIDIHDAKTIEIPATDPIGVNIDLGKLPDCFRRSGICTAEPTAQRKRQPGVELFGEMFIDENSNLVMKFPRSEMIPEVENEQFGNDVFPLLDAFKLPSDILRELQIKANYWIEAGNYPLVQTKDHYVASFNLSARK
jgi:hypothetical protein